MKRARQVTGAFTLAAGIISASVQAQEIRVRETIYLAGHDGAGESVAIPLCWLSKENNVVSPSKAFFVVNTTDHFLAQGDDGSYFGMFTSSDACLAGGLRQALDNESTYLVVDTNGAAPNDRLPVFYSGLDGDFTVMKSKDGPLAVVATKLNEKQARNILEAGGFALQIK